MEAKPGIFQDVTLGWDGIEKTIKAGRLLRVIAMVEDVVTLPELYKWSQRGAMPFAKLAIAYGILLRYAGFTVTDEEVHRKMFDVDAGQATQNAAAAAMQTLLMVMIPPSALLKENKEGKTPEGTKEAL